MTSGLTIAEARALPSPILKGVTLGEAANLKTDALIRKQQEQATDSGLVAADALNIEYGAFNITRADGSVLIAYANSRSPNQLLHQGCKRIAFL